MKRRIRIMLLSGILMISACRGNVGQQETTYIASQNITDNHYVETTTATEPEAQSTITEINQNISSFDDFDSFQYSWTDDSGYTYLATVKISPWILYSDTDTINGAWNVVSGGKALPVERDWQLEKYSGGLYSRQASGESMFKAYMTDMYYSMGTIEIKNITDGWSLSSERVGKPIFDMTWFSTDKVDFGDAFMSMTLYSDKTTLLNSKIQIRPTMTSDNWGPVTFCLMHAENITPKYPEGQYHAEMTSGVLTYGYASAGYFIPEKYSIPIYPK